MVSIFALLFEMNGGRFADAEFDVKQYFIRVFNTFALCWIMQMHCVPLPPRGKEQKLAAAADRRREARRR
jgi:hypothetical protein